MARVEPMAFGHRGVKIVLVVILQRACIAVAAPERHCLHKL